MPFPKGNKLGGRPLGSKNRTTLLQDERRAIFESQVSQKWEEIIDKLRPEYVADQYLGKAPDKVEHTIEDKRVDEVAKAAASKAYVDSLKDAGV